MIGLVVQKPAKPLARNNEGRPQVTVVLSERDEAKFYAVKADMREATYSQVVRRLIRRAYAVLKERQRRKGASQ